MTSLTEEAVNSSWRAGVPRSSPACHSATYRSSCVLYLSQRHLQVFLCTAPVTAPPTGLSCVLHLSQRHLQVFLCAAPVHSGHLQVFLCTVPVTAPPTGLPVYFTSHSATFRPSCVLTAPVTAPPTRLLVYLLHRHLLQVAHLQAFLCSYCTGHSATYRGLKGPWTLILTDFSFRSRLWYIPPTKYFHTVNTGIYPVPQ